jgi:DNA-binding response OmpR family regulator
MTNRLRTTGRPAVGARSAYSQVVATKVLVVEDDATVSSVVSAYLERDGYDCRIAIDGPSADQTWVQWQPELVILDVMLPGFSGLEVLRRRRESGDETPVVMLSAHGEEEDRVVGLEFGADDYLVKPFSPRELALRVQGLLRREQRLHSGASSRRPIVRAGLLIDLAAHRVTQDGQEIQLTHREFDLLAFLASYPDRAFTKEELLRRVWGWDFGDTSTVTVHVRRLREKLEPDPSDPQLVLTVRGVGYRFAEASDSSPSDSSSSDSSLPEARDE